MGQSLRGAILPKVKRRPERLADPYRDIDVIDSRAPRFNQVVIGTLAFVAVVAGWPWLLALLVLQLVVGLTMGRRYCLPCLAYFEFVQPYVGEGQLEDARPPRFANMVGASFLTASVLAYVLGIGVLGAVLGLVVAALALLAAATGLRGLRDVQAGLRSHRAPVRRLSGPPEAARRVRPALTLESDARGRERHPLARKVTTWNLAPLDRASKESLRARSARCECSRWLPSCRS